MWRASLAALARRNLADHSTADRFPAARELSADDHPRARMTDARTSPAWVNVHSVQQAAKRRRSMHASPEESIDRLDRLAARKGLTRSEYLRRAIEAAFAADEPQEATRAS